MCLVTAPIRVGSLPVQCSSPPAFYGIGTGLKRIDCLRGKAQSTEQSISLVRRCSARLCLAWLIKALLPQDHTWAVKKCGSRPLLFFVEVAWVCLCVCVKCGLCNCLELNKYMLQRSIPSVLYFAIFSWVFKRFLTTGMRQKHVQKQFQEYKNNTMRCEISRKKNQHWMSVWRGAGTACVQGRTSSCQDIALQNGFTHLVVLHSEALFLKVF